MKRYGVLLSILLFTTTSLACNLISLRGGESTPLADLPLPVDTAIPSTTPLPPTLTPTFTPSPTATVTPSPTATPFGCMRPPDDYTVIEMYEEIEISQRTLFMLNHAQTLYDGDHDFVKALTQGSYHPGVGASFGTHDGGGAVDISVRDLTNFHNVLYDEFPAMILALRQAGFAAWIREESELYIGSPLHIHAIAIGDRDLSEAATRQLTGPEGYFRGFNGLPEDPPIPDEWGEPVLCPWMIEMSYEDLRP